MWTVSTTCVHVSFCVVLKSPLHANCIRHLCTCVILCVVLRSPLHMVCIHHLCTCVILCVVLKSPLRVDCILHLYVCMCHFQCGGGSMMTITCVILQLSCIQYMLIYIQCMASGLTSTLIYNNKEVADSHLTYVCT